MQINRDIINRINGRLVSVDEEDFSYEVNRLCHDTRLVEEGDLFAGIKTSARNGSDYYTEAVKKGATLLLLDREPEEKLKIPVIVVDNVLETMEELACISRNNSDAIIIGITGSSGKTSTKEMCAQVLKNAGKTFMNRGNYNNHLGVCISLIEFPHDAEYGIFEIGTSSKGEIRQLTELIRPEIALFTIIGHSHMENFSDLREVYEEKIQLFRGLTGRKIAVLNMDDEYLSKQRPENNERIIFYSTENEEADVLGYDYISQGENSEFKIKLKEKTEILSVKLSVPGVHMMKNALCVAGISAILKIPAKIMIESFEKFVSAAGRMNFKDINGIRVIDDCYNANPDSVISSLEVLKSIKTEGRKIVFLGDMLELGEISASMHEKIGEFVKNSEIDYFFGIGKEMKSAVFSAIANGMSEENVKWYCNSEDFSCENDFFNINDIVLVKGSRGMKMERIFEKI